jgi:putative FmdB family regulatory protein
VPTYQYVCTECGGQLEAVQKFTDEPLTTHEACGGRLRKVFSPVGIVFKGSGFYRTDSRNGSSPSSSSTPSSATSESESKPAASESTGSKSAASESTGSNSAGSNSAGSKPAGSKPTGSERPDKSGKSSSSGSGEKAA